MKTIVIDARESGTSTGRYIDKLVEYLHKLEPPFKVILLAKSHRVEYLKSIAPSFEIKQSNYKEFTFAEQIGLRRQLKKLGADLVHFGMTQQPILYKGRSVTTVHDLTTARFNNTSKNIAKFKFKQLVYRQVIKIVAKKSAHLITPSEFVKNDLAKFARVNKNKITVTPEAVDEFDEPPKPVPGFEGRRYIMFNGRPLPHKNLRRLIEAFAILAPKYPDLYLMLAGKKNALVQSYIDLAEKLGVAERVVQTDWITDGQLKWAMQHTQAYIWASLSEGFGLPPLEAMLNGAPVVSSNASCMPEVLGDAVHYFDPLDVNDMAAKISEVLDSSALRKELIAKGREQINKYSWKKMAEQTLAVYKKALDD